MRRLTLKPEWVGARFAICALAVSLFVPPITRRAVTPPLFSSRAVHADQSAARNDILARQHLCFEANWGQATPVVRFLSRGPGYVLAIAPTEAVLGLPIADFQSRNPERDHMPVSPTARSEGSKSAIDNPGSDSVRLKFIGARAAARVVGVDELPGKANYLIGSDSRKWRRDV